MTVLDTFDAPVMTPHCELRPQTTVAPQSLLLMNDTFILDNARRLADRLHTEIPDDEKARLERAWQLLYGKTPGESEVARAINYLRLQTATLTVHHAQNPPAAPAKGAPPLPSPDPAREAFASLCQILLSSNRFLYLE